MQVQILRLKSTLGFFSKEDFKDLNYVRENLKPEKYNIVFDDNEDDTYLEGLISAILRVVPDEKHIVYYNGFEIHLSDILLLNTYLNINYFLLTDNGFKVVQF